MSEQLSLDVTQPLRRPDDERAGRFSTRSGAPETQRAAAMQVMPKTGTQRRKVLDCLADEPLTDEQIEKRISIGQRQVSTRRKELEMDGWVEDSGERRVSSAGASVAVWRLTAQGSREYSEI